MIFGLGNDIIEVSRIERIINKHADHFLNRIFTKSEQEYCLKHQAAARHFAGRFAAKEAVVKALGTGIQKGTSWLDIEIINDSQGKPCVSLSPRLEDKLNGMTIQLTISHCKEYATAVAIVYKT